MSARYARLIASLICLAILGLWIWGIVSLTPYLTTLPKWAEPIFFLLAGLGWILPMRPIFDWMHRQKRDSKGPSTGIPEDARTKRSESQ